MAYPTEPVELAGLWLATISTIGFWSYALYGDNPYFRWAEHTFVGTSVGVFFVTMVQTLNSKLWVDLMGGRLDFIILLIAGLMVFLRFSDRTAYISRWPIAIIVGVSTGFFMKGTLEGDILVSIKGTMRGIGGPFAPDPWIAFSNLVLFLGVIFSLTYFIFTHEHTGALGAAARLGRYFIMAMVGIYAGNILMLRSSLLLGRVIPVLQTLGILPF